MTLQNFYKFCCYGVSLIARTPCYKNVMLGENKFFLSTGNTAKKITVGRLVK